MGYDISSFLSDDSLQTHDLLDENYKVVTKKISDVLGTAQNVYVLMIFSTIPIVLDEDLSTVIVGEELHHVLKDLARLAQTN